MAGQTGVDRRAIKTMLDTLRTASERVAVLKVSKPAAGEFGNSGSGHELLALMDEATERITKTLSNLAQALDDFGDAIRAAERAVDGADEDAAVYAKKMNAGLDLMSQPFFENLGKDKRFQVQDLPGILGGLTTALEKSVAGGKFDDAGS